MQITVSQDSVVLFRGNRLDFSAWLRPAAGLTFLSVCSGIEAASVAWSSLGWRALGFAEIEKFPSAVLAHHYPNVPNYGDFTKIDPAPLRGRVDILCGGTPCQAFSVAGMRGSLDDARGNLTLAFVDLAHAINPRNVVWENVPGVLSTKDNAFGCFLAGLVGASEPLIPIEPAPAAGKSNRRWGWSAKQRAHYIKWPRAGVVVGPKGRAAWTIKDAQYFGLAQRRERVLVVADFGNGADPAAVLFEPEGVRRDSPPRRETGERPAPTISARTKGGGGLGTDFDLDGGLIHAIQERAVSENLENGPQGKGYPPHIAYTLEARNKVQAVAYGGNNTSAGGHTGSHANAGVMPAICQSVALRGREGGATAELGDDLAHALRASGGGGDKPHVLAFNSSAQADQLPDASRDTSINDGLTCSQYPAAAIGSAVRRLTPRECERLQGFQWQCAPEYPGAWQDHSGRWWSPDYTAIKYGNISKAKLDADFVKYMARGNPKRLTREDVAGLASDGPRYKALGNSWAVPKFTWLGERIEMLMP